MEEIQIQVRNLSGESTIVSISPSKTVADLKLLLSASFPSASSSSSPNFHLFLKGTKLAMKSQIGSLLINSGDFIALIPFTKKGLQSKQSAARPQTSPPTTHSEAAEAAWRDMMEDLSYLNSTPNCEQRPEPIADDLFRKRKDAMLEAHVTSKLSKKRGRMSTSEIKGGFDEELISCILQFSRKHTFDKDLCGSIFKILESVCCLLDVKTGKCVLFSNTNMKDSSQPSLSCRCPAWLKTTIKGFTFLNILAGFFQVIDETITFDYVKDSLDKLCKLGFCLSMEDLTRLSDVCPKVVYFVDQEAETTKSLDTIIICNPSGGKSDQVRDNCMAARKRVPMSKIVNSINKRQTLFRATLEDGLSLLMREGNYAYKNTFAMEQLIASIKKAEPISHRKAAARDTSSSPSRSIHSRCRETHPLSPWSMLEHLKKGLGSKGQIVHAEEINARVADLTEIPDELSANSKFALNALGITKLYSHQAESIKASLCGKNVVVATMTSSGKSLCYNVPVLEALSQNMLSCALYLFPTKALAQDQLRSLLAMTERFKHLNVGVYDGDTCQAQRKRLRDNSRLLITNPDMLHLSILPFHGQFQRILSNLK